MTTKNRKTMKKMLLSALAMAALSITPAMAWEVAITKQQLPAEAQAFLSKNFAKNEVVVATHDKDITDNDYTVILDDGTKIEFSGAGKWESVKNKAAKIPAGIIPAQIANFVKAQYNGVGIVQIEAKLFGYEVELSNDLELKFDKAGRCIGIDD